MKFHKEKYSWIEMNNHTVVQLKAVSKERGIWDNYTFREAELVHALEAATLVEQTSNIFEKPIENNPTPVLQPWRPSNITTKDKENKKKFITMGMQKIKDFREWLLNYIPPRPKVVDKVLESFETRFKNVRKEGYFVPTNIVQICFEIICDTVSNKRIKWIRPRIISA